MNKNTYFRFRLSRELLDSIKRRTSNASDYIRSLIENDLDRTAGDTRPFPRTPYIYHAELIEVIDGDTLLLNLNVGFEITIRAKVRLLGVTAPELTSKKGRDAKRFIERRLAKANLIVETRKRGKFGRYLAKIHYDKIHKDFTEIIQFGKLLNDELIENGYAKNS